MTLNAPWATVIAALIAAFLGSWIGAIAALTRFKRERAFDRQLDWYEKTIRTLYEMALRIDIATTFKDDPKTPPELLAEVWQKVQRMHIDLERLASEAPLYASKEAAKRSVRISDDMQQVADQTEAFDPVSHDLTEEQMELIVQLA